MANIAFDTTSTHSATASGTTSPLSVTVNIIAGETGFCSIDIDATSLIGVSVSGITGGGTWTLVSAKNAAAGSRSELWTNGVNGGSSASSISIAITGTITAVAAAVGQWTGGGTIVTANATTSNGTTSPLSISLTTTAVNSWVIAGFSAKGTTPTMTASTGNLRATAATSVTSVGLCDNTVANIATSVSNAVTIGTVVDWAANAVELQASAPAAKLSTFIPANLNVANRIVRQVGPQSIVPRQVTPINPQIPAQVYLLTIIPSTLSIPLGNTYQLQAYLSYTNNFSLPVTNSPNTVWSSSNTAVATVSSTGFVTTLTTGTTNIIATWTAAGYGVFIATCPVTVTVATLIGVACTPEVISLPAGYTNQMEAIAYYSDGTNSVITPSSVTWSTNDAPVATISSTGLLTGVSTGSATITATYSGKSGNSAVTVTSPVLVSIAVTPSNPTVLYSSTESFTATGTYSDSSTSNITTSCTWTSSNTTVATIGSSTGIATTTALGGSSLITATDGSISGNTLLNVTSPSPSPTPVTLVAILATPQNPNVTVNGTVQLTSWAIYSNGTFKNVTNSTNWSSSAISICSVGALTGLVTGKSVGTGLVTASFNGFNATSSINVIKGTSTIITAGAPMASSKPTPTNTTPTIFQPIHTQDQTLTLIQQRLSNALAPMQNSPIMTGGFRNIVFPTQTTTDSTGTWVELLVQHGLNSTSVEWLTGTTNAPGIVYVSPNNNNPANNPAPTKQILLRSNVPGLQVSLWFFTV